MVAAVGVVCLVLALLGRLLAPRLRLGLALQVPVLVLLMMLHLQTLVVIRPAAVQPAAEGLVRLRLGSAASQAGQREVERQ